MTGTRGPAARLLHSGLLSLVFAAMLAAATAGPPMWASQSGATLSAHTAHLFATLREHGPASLVLESVSWVQAGLPRKPAQLRMLHDGSALPPPGTDLTVRNATPATGQRLAAVLDTLKGVAPYSARAPPLRRA